MSNEAALQKINQLLDDGQAEKASAVIVQSLAKLSLDPRSILPILDGLDRERKHTTLLPIITKLQESNFLQLECLMFDLRIKFRTGDYVGALKSVDKILAMSSDNIEALRTGGRIGNLTKDQGVALRYWERLARASASDPEAALQTARIYLRREQHAQALDWAEQAAQRRPEATEALQIAVSAGLEMGWPERCDPLLARLFAIDRTRALAALSRLVQELECESAARVLSLLKQRFATDQAIADIAAKAFSKWLVAALEQELSSHELDAATFYRAARSVQPGDQNAQRALERLSMPSLHAMREAFNSRDFPSAIEHGAMAARINPECFEAWQTVGRAQFSRANIADAINAFRRCTELNPKDARSWLTYGLALNQEGERRAALAAFKKGRGLTDSDVKKEADASISALHPLLVRDANQAAANGNNELAWEASGAALEIRPDDPAIIQLRRNVLRQQREQISQAWNTASDSVADLCRRYLEKSPGDLYASTVLGRTLMRARAYAEALPVWEGLCTRKSDDSHNHLQVARCCRSLKIRDKGLLATERALRLDPELGEAVEIADFLKALPTSPN